MRPSVPGDGYRASVTGRGEPIREEIRLQILSCANELEGLSLGLDAYLDRSTVAQTVARPLRDAKSPVDYGASEVPLPGFEPGFPP